MKRRGGSCVTFTGARLAATAPTMPTPRRGRPGPWVTGPLLRRAATEGTRDPAHFGLGSDRPTLLVTGGSLGAQTINTWVVESLTALLAQGAIGPSSLQVLHATGEGLGHVAERYDTLGLQHHTTPYIQAMGHAYASADAFIGRGGAGTVSELQRWGVPAVIVPYPHHKDGHQARNAAPLVASGQACVIEQDSLDAEAFAREVLSRLRAPRSRSTRAPEDARGATWVAEDFVRYVRESECA